MTNTISGFAAQKPTTTMSSLEIAKLTDKLHRNVVADIRKTLSEAGIDAAEFSAALPYAKGFRQVFNLPRLECDLVMSGYSVKYRLAIIRRWHELEATQAAPRPAALLPKDIAANLQRLTPDNFRHIRYYLMGMVEGQVRDEREMAVLV